MKKIVILISLLVLSFFLFAQGPGGYCLYYNGSTDYLEFSDIAALNNTSAFTVSFWMNQDDNTAYDRLFHIIDDPSTEDISIASYSGDLYFEVGNGANSFGFWPNYADSIASGSWFHVAAVFDGTLTGNANRAKLFIDGIHRDLTFTSTIPATTYDFSGLTQFVSFNINPQFFGGYLDELRVWNYARSQAQINADMNKSLVGTEPGLEGYWKFDENTGQTAYDSTTNNNDATLGSTGGGDSNDPDWGDSDAPLPVTLSSFTAEFSGGASLLTWTTQSESNNLGWNAYRSDTDAIAESFQINQNMIEGAGTTSEETHHVFSDGYETYSNTSYWYWIESVDNSGSTSLHGPVEVFVADNEDNEFPPELTENYGLAQNYPNPFNPTTKIAFKLTESDAKDSSITIYNTKGEIVKVFDNLVTNANEIGFAFWDGNDRNGYAVSSGIYLYKMKAGGRYTSTKKMILLK